MKSPVGTSLDSSKSSKKTCVYHHYLSFAVLTLNSLIVDWVRQTMQMFESNNILLDNKILVYLNVTTYALLIQRVLFSIFELDKCFRKGKQSCLPPICHWMETIFFYRKTGHKLMLSQEVMNTSSAATWYKGLIC